jgi:hypothetical protein
MPAETNPRKWTWTGRVLTALPVLFLTWDALIKVTHHPMVAESMQRLGWPSIEGGIGVVELACVLIYLVPRSSLLGAVLLTGYLGGAIATHVRVGDPLFSHSLFPVYVAAMVWGGLLLRDRRLRSLIVSYGVPSPR